MRYVQGISCQYCKYIIICYYAKLKNIYSRISYNTQFSKRDSKDVLSTSRRTVLCIYLNMIGYRKILIGHFMIFYKILRYPTIFFWDIPDAHWNIRGIVFVNLGQFEVFSG